MNDPHVERLMYSLVTDESVDYDKADPMIAETDDFVVTLSNEGAIFQMKTHFTTEAEAKALVEPFVMDWLANESLEKGPDEFRLNFSSAEIIDRKPDPGSGRVISASVQMRGSGRLDAFPHVSRGSFPRPPQNFRLCPVAVRMLARLNEYRRGRDKLLSMAFNCLTILEKSASTGNHRRAKAAAKYRISSKILSKLGELASSGDERQARKAPRGAYEALSAEELAWIEAAVKLLIRRVCEWEYDPNGLDSEITMADLPKLL